MIFSNRFLILGLLLAAAVVSYSVGFAVGAWLLIAVGVAFELAFWFQLFFRRRGR